jgi:hypothetical protein
MPIPSPCGLQDPTQLAAAEVHAGHDTAIISSHVPVLPADMRTTFAQQRSDNFSYADTDSAVPELNNSQLWYSCLSRQAEL